MGRGAGDYKRRRTALQPHYSLWPTAGDGCAYCGVAADTYDHVPSLEMVHTLGPSHFERAGVKLYLVPACQECNSLLGRSPMLTVTERRKVVKGKLRPRYAKFLSMPDWHPDELDETRVQPSGCRRVRGEHQGLDSPALGLME